MDDHTTTTPGLAVECGSCGHPAGDHKSNRASFAGRLRFGICLRRGCLCGKYEPMTTELRLTAALDENRRLRELLATLGWGPSRLAEHLDVPTPGVESPQRP